MPPKLKDNPREWKKFAAVAVLFLSFIASLLWRRAWISDLALQALLALFACLLILALIRPVSFRPLYLAGMRFSHAMGLVVGRILLILCFVLLLTPLAYLLRFLGHDLLQLRRPKSCQTYWKPARRPSHPDRSF
jgi:hypothetical protein